ncbi:MAG: hypothetical protein AAFU77_14720 [Myxococcota bacterium]
MVTCPLYLFAALAGLYSGLSSPAPSIQSQDATACEAPAEDALEPLVEVEVPYVIARTDGES